eukprot:TRINITY_DN67496_c11_g2_i1.p1 TRINITY_DN67496_c11_g2~~TRINITY_DN67496_c11_g2_i1.p1  ORF type:complete len:237 (+),score=24.79 TRINITY_DN67496_c11_g2_i1:35-745(+)
MRWSLWGLCAYAFLLWSIFSVGDAQVTDDDGDTDTDTICLTKPNFLVNFGNCLRQSSLFSNCLTTELNKVSKVCDFNAVPPCDPTQVYNNFRDVSICACRTYFTSCATQAEGTGRTCSDIEVPVDSLCDDDSDTDDDGLSGGAIAGIVIGSTCCLLICLGLIIAALVMMMKKAKRRRRKPVYGSYGPPPPAAVPPPGPPVYQMPAATPVVAQPVDFVAPAEFVGPAGSSYYPYYGY